ncbi:MAG: lipid-A-disaccharide synthase [Candidatus Omnitrophica bacterium]|nr:lipid-A-disaccharide synthase [Candidatus Omnitrophota bacterium]
MTASKPLKLMMIAGEASGDLHGASLAKSLRHLSPEIVLFGAGGELMKEAGVHLEVDLVEKAVVGLVEVLRHLSEFKKFFAHLLKRLEAEKPDAVILIDYPGFNLRFAKAAKRLGIRVIYYISPQVWAWGRWRIPTIRECVDQMIVVFPFEEIFYKRHGIQTQFVGHPLLDLVKVRSDPEDLRRELSIPREKKVIGLLPGSREKEVSSLLPVMIEAARLLARRLPDYRFLIFKSPTLPDKTYTTLSAKNLPLNFVKDPDYRYRNLIDFSLVASGTATLENAILGKPMVILYKTSLLTYLLARNLIQIPYIGLVNVVAGEKIVPECLQYHATPRHVAETALSLLENPGKLERMRRDLTALREKLGQEGASHRAAEAILKGLDNTASVQSR